MVVYSVCVGHRTLSSASVVCSLIFIVYAMARVRIGLDHERKCAFVRHISHELLWLVAEARVNYWDGRKMWRSERQLDSSDGDGVAWKAPVGYVYCTTKYPTARDKTLPIRMYCFQGPVALQVNGNCIGGVVIIMIFRNEMRNYLWSEKKNKYGGKPS